MADRVPKMLQVLGDVTLTREELAGEAQQHLLA